METIIRFNELRSVVGLSRATIWRKEREGSFPARRQLGPNSVGWCKSEVDSWLQSRSVVGGTRHG